MANSAALRVISNTNVGELCLRAGRQRVRGVYMKLASPQTGLALVVLAFVYMRPALTVRLNYGFIMTVNSMEFNGVRPARNIQFGLESDLRLGRSELNLRPDSCKHSTGKTLHPN